jgi:peptidoglycan/LPS O-acetylase OafA/YrhL
VDALRALAALAVLLAHVPHHAPDGALTFPTVLLLPLDFGYLGVPLFLVLSGFCIHRAVARQLGAGAGARVPWGRFWRRRIFRLYPPYAVAAGASLALYLALGSAAYASHERIASVGWDLGTHLLLVHNLFKDYATGLGNGPFWTLGLEEQLYALYFVYLLLRSRIAPGRLLLGLFAVAIAWRWGVPALWQAAGAGAPEQQVFGQPPLQLGGWRYWPLGHWFAWCLGAVAAEVDAGVIRLPRVGSTYRTATALFAVSVLCNPVTLGRVAGSAWLRGQAAAVWLVPLLNFCTHLADPAFALACFVLLNRWVRAESAGRFNGRWVWPLAGIGLMSYSLYLTHAPVLHLLEACLAPGDGWPALAIRYAVYVPLCLLVGLAFFWAVERHFLHPPPRKAAVATQKGELLVSTTAAAL